MAALAPWGCKDKGDDATAVAEGTLPTLRFGDETPDLMLTWIDPNGVTHVEGKPAHVPNESRDFVRVLVIDSDDGSRDPIYVVDLNKKEPDETYLAKTVPRRVWEDEIDRRRSRNPVIAEGPANADRPRGPGRSDRTRPEDRTPAPDDSRPRAGDPTTGFTVIIYGASWCGACRQAHEYLKKRRTPVTFKDIDKDGGARAEMDAKLARAGRRTNGIPVIDVGGQILLGFDARGLDAAIEKAAGIAL
jgi:glutaredoxin